MTLWAVPRLYRRAILIYLGTLVAPMAALVWLGIESLELVTGDVLLAGAGGARGTGDRAGHPLGGR